MTFDEWVADKNIAAYGGGHLPLAKLAFEAGQQNSEAEPVYPRRASDGPAEITAVDLRKAGWRPRGIFWWHKDWEDGRYVRFSKACEIYDEEQAR